MVEFIDKETKWVYENYSENIINLATYLNRITSNLDFPDNIEDPYKIPKNNFEWFNYYHREMFLDVSKIKLDFINFSNFLSNRNNALYGDHTIAYRLINLSKIYPQLLGRDQDIALHILNLDCAILSDDSFTIMSKGYNHAVDQLFGLICYHHYVQHFGSEHYAAVLTELKNEIFNSVDECFIHIENTPDYHYYAMQRITAINDVIEDADLSELLIKMTDYLSYITPEKGAQIVNVGDSAGKYVWNDLKDPVLDTALREPIKYFKTGYLAYTKNNKYFYIKSSKKHWNHHHYDNASYVFWKNKQNFIVDSGAFSYQHDDPNRLYCLSPFAHNIFCMPNNELIYSNYNDTDYLANSLRISENKFLFQVKMYSDILSQRIVTLGEAGILFEDTMIGVPESTKYLYNLVHCNPNARITNLSNTDFSIGLNEDSIKIRVLASPDFTASLINDGICDNLMIGFYSEKFYSINSNPTIVFKVGNKNNNNFYFSYYLEF